MNGASYNPKCTNIALKWSIWSHLPQNELFIKKICQRLKPQFVQIWKQVQRTVTERCKHQNFWVKICPIRTKLDFSQYRDICHFHSCQMLQCCTIFPKNLQRRFRKMFKKAVLRDKIYIFEPKIDSFYPKMSFFKKINCSMFF